MAKHVIHISELEAAHRFATLLARLGAGEEIVIEDDSHPVFVVYPAEPPVRLLSESLRLAREHGSTATLDEDFGKDVEAGIASHQEPLESAPGNTNQAGPMDGHFVHGRRGAVTPVRP